MTERKRQYHFCAMRNGEYADGTIIYEGIAPWEAIDIMKIRQYICEAAYKSCDSKEITVISLTLI